MSHPVRMDRDFVTPSNHFFAITIITYTETTRLP